MAVKNIVKCYVCKEEVVKLEGIKVNISMNEKTTYRHIHKECNDEYLEIIENKRTRKYDYILWDELYQYVKKEIFEYDDRQKLSHHTVLRLQGLRSGKYIPNKNTKVILSEKGYGYDVILMTFKVKKMDIKYAITDKSKFKDGQNMTNYMIAIIQSSINDVYIRMKEKEESDKRIENVRLIDDDKKYRYEKENQKKDNKVADKLSHLW